MDDKRAYLLIAPLVLALMVASSFLLKRHFLRFHPNYHPPVAQSSYYEPLRRTHVYSRPTATNHNYNRVAAQKRGLASAAQPIYRTPVARASNSAPAQKKPSNPKYHAIRMALSYQPHQSAEGDVEPVMNQNQLDEDLRSQQAEEAYAALEIRHRDFLEKSLGLDEATASTILFQKRAFETEIKAIDELARHGEADTETMRETATMRYQQWVIDFMGEDNSQQFLNLH